MYLGFKCNIDDFDKYFSAIGAINYLCSQTHKSHYEIVNFLLNNQYVSKLKSYKKKSLSGQDFAIFEMVDDNIKVDKLSAIKYLLKNLDDYPDNKKIEYFPYPEEITYWHKDEFLSLVETINLFKQFQKLNKQVQNLEHSPNLQNLLKTNDPYISVFNIFEIIKNKTDLKSDQEIANLLQTIDITKKSPPFNKAKYFNGKPIELFRDHQNKTLTEMDLLLIELSSGEICISSNDQRLKNFVFDKFDFFFEFRDITNFDLDSEDIDQADSFDKILQDNEIPLFYLNDTFSLIEAACVLSGDNPIQMYRCFNDTNFDQNYPSFNEAYNFINSAVKAGSLPEDTIHSHQLKTYLRSKGKIINAFNDNTPNPKAINFGTPTIQQTEPNIEKLNSEITQLRKLIAEKDVEIAALNKLNKLNKSIDQITHSSTELSPEEEIPVTRTRNTVLRIIAVLADMAGLPKEPFTSYNMMEAHSIQKNLKLPSKGPVADWLNRSRNSS